MTYNCKRCFDTGVYMDVHYDDCWFEECNCGATVDEETDAEALYIDRAPEYVPDEPADMDDDS